MTRHYTLFSLAMEEVAENRTFLQKTRGVKVFFTNYLVLYQSLEYRSVFQRRR